MKRCDDGSLGGIINGFLFGARFENGYRWFLLAYEVFDLDFCLSATERSEALCFWGSVSAPRLRLICEGFALATLFYDVYATGRR